MGEYTKKTWYGLWCGAGAGMEVSRPIHVLTLEIPHQGWHRSRATTSYLQRSSGSIPPMKLEGHLAPESPKAAMHQQTLLT